jgi:hypothetical protein
MIKSRRMRLVQYVSYMGEKKNHEVNTSLGKPRCRSKDNNKMGLKKIG